MANNETQREDTTDTVLAGEQHSLCDHTARYSKLSKRKLAWALATNDAEHGFIAPEERALRFCTYYALYKKRVLVRRCADRHGPVITFPTDTSITVRISDRGVGPAMGAPAAAYSWRMRSVNGGVPTGAPVA